MGPVITAEARERVTGFVGRGEEEGAQLALDGRELTSPGTRRASSSARPSSIT